ncbi:flavonol 7-O-beta-glucosyltransferase UGT74F1-like [Impatiens glandulifera]|uniref:flavonol 7-O-beta-glucosyltransferase UGT74F1-like n=1 Tax=Impatiens glandulifera TaxID=253017 RepID=UPI001FB195C6|nr:flavonol 7-O-beta-glucosyltransferase UGT74F1-like [Impatiens glandulifera]
MENQASTTAYKAHIIVLPFYAQGHINPVLQIAKRFASKVIKITVASLASVGSAVHHESFSFEPIYDDYKEGGYAGPGGYKGFVQRFDATAPVNLIQVIKKLEQTKHPVKCLLYDQSVSWAIDIAKQQGLASFAFFTMCCTMIASLYPLYHELVNEPLPISSFPLPDLPEMRSPYVPSMGSTTSRFSPLVGTLVEQIKDIGRADRVLFNTYNELEQEVISDYFLHIFIVFPIIS